MPRAFRFPLLPVVALVGWLSACGNELPNTPLPAVVQAVFDPSRSDVPSPTDLVMRDGQVYIAPNPDLPEADNALKALLNGRDGFSTASSLRVRFSGPVSAASVNETSIVALDLGPGGRGPIAPAEVIRTWNACDDSLGINSPTRFTPGHRYLFAVRGEGAEQGLVGTKGEKVVASPAFHFLRAGEDLREHPDAFPGSRAERQAAAEALEAVRSAYEPLFEVLEAHGLPRREVAVLWTFTATTETEALFDATSKALPMPNDLLRDPRTGRVTLPISPEESEASQALKRGFNQLDGFSTTAALTLDLSAPLDRNSAVGKQTVWLAEAESGKVKEDVEVTVTEDGKKLIIQPLSPLLPATQYVLVAAGIRDTQTRPVEAMPLSQLLSLPHPLVDGEGQSQISSLCAETAARLEGLRGQIDPVLTKLEVPRRDIAAVWTFRTQDILARLEALQEAPYREDLPLTVDDVVNKSPLERGLPLFQVARVITGKMTTIDYLDPVTRAFRENGAGIPTQIDFVLTLPRGLDQGERVPVVVFGHGLTTERRLGLFLADKLAGAGFAMMAIDFPLHGNRTVCVKDDDCESGATCAVDGICLKDGKRADLRRLPAPAGWDYGIPVTTGQAFIDVENLFATRDHFRQAIVDVSAQTRLIQQLDWAEVTGGFHLDGERISYVGISLGSILGTTFGAANPAFDAMLLNVGGAGLPDLMQESATFGPTLRDGLAAKGILENTPEHFAFINATKWVLDEIDPINLGRYIAHTPREGASPKRLRLHMAQGDAVVPNTSTHRLAAATYIDKETQFRSFIGTHGFLANPTELACYPGQDDMVDFLEGTK